MLSKTDRSEVPSAKPRKPRSSLKPMQRNPSRSVSPGPRNLGVERRPTSISPSRFRKPSWQNLDEDQNSNR